jgi:hypothetical protein
MKRKYTRGAGRGTRKLALAVAFLAVEERVSFAAATEALLRLAAPALLFTDFTTVRSECCRTLVALTDCHCKVNATSQAARKTSASLGAIAALMT